MKQWSEEVERKLKEFVRRHQEITQETLHEYAQKLGLNQQAIEQFFREFEQRK
uniref:engrailed homeodomain n=1 Tax=Escherichia coli TaxID=562 RepID=UPI00004EAC69|nr:Chain A, engrailed homeodomain [Escherichia coli]1Y66_B Chain B, engrailed homeodomain [Escherichia coli]1Y66_C Chain C, engrailed homeodomain [Escherichia coli]1Y66_D Chain D, engrailed homeodomain [Escherichia coli]